jgi:hypothetical protein
MDHRRHPAFVLARLKRIARRATSGRVRTASVFRTVVASLVRVASREADIFARASYIEGLMNYSPGSIARNYASMFRDAQKAIESGRYDQSPIARVLVDERGVKPEEALRFLSNKDVGISKALLRGVKSIVKEPVRGLEADDIAASITVGFSPITGGPLKYGEGKGAFYWLGTQAPPQISLGGLARIVSMEGANRAKDVVRGTNVKEKQQVSLSQPISKDDLTDMLQDIVADEAAVGRATFIELADSLINDPGTMRIIDNEIRNSLGGELQEAVWASIRSDPELLKVDRSGIGVHGKALAQDVSRTLGREVSRPAVAKNFKQKVLPAIMLALKEDSVAMRALKKKEIYDIIYEETRRRDTGHSKTRVTPKGYGAQGQHGEVRYLSEDEFGQYQEIPTRQPPAWLQRLKSDPDLRALEKAFNKAAAARRLVARYQGAQKEAVQMSGPVARKYKRAQDWAKNNWQAFYNAMSEKFDTDALAMRLAAAIGERNAWRDVDHYVWNIAYDTERNVRSGIFY